MFFGTGYRFLDTSDPVLGPDIHNIRYFQTGYPFCPVRFTTLRRREKEGSGPGDADGTTRGSSTLSSKVNLPLAINFRAKFGHVAPHNFGSTKPSNSTEWRCVSSDSLASIYGGQIERSLPHLDRFTDLKCCNRDATLTNKTVAKEQNSRRLFKPPLSLSYR